MLATVIQKPVFQLAQSECPFIHVCLSVREKTGTPLTIDCTPIVRRLPTSLSAYGDTIHKHVCMLFPLKSPLTSISHTVHIFDYKENKKHFTFLEDGYECLSSVKRYNSSS